MPLHLLGKKSWNVYNADNIARVRRDEAAAKAAEEAEERRMQDIGAERRLAILRGEALPPLPEDEFHPAEGVVVAADAARSRLEPSSLRKRRKRAGEDDTDFEMRLAREKSDAKHDAPRPATLPTRSSAALVDEGGHISLFGDQRSRARAEKNEEAEAEAKKKQREFEDQYTMRFSNAAGREGLARPWYSQADGAAPDVSAKDIWGNDDSNRRQRDAQRIVSGDPLAMMKKGASQVRDLKKERKKVQEERDEDLRQLKSEGHRERHRRRDEDTERRRSISHRHDSRRSRLKDTEDRHDDRDTHRDERRHREDRHRRRHSSRSRSRSPRRNHDRRGRERS